LACTGPVEVVSALELLPPPSLQCEQGPRRSGPLTDPAASSFDRCGRPCTTPPLVCGHRRTTRPAQTPWMSSRRCSVGSPSTSPRPMQTPCMPPFPPWYRGWQTRPGPLLSCSQVAPTAPTHPPMAPPPARVMRGHPPDHAPRHLHRRRVRHPPPFHKHPPYRQKRPRPGRMTRNGPHMWEWS
jgi:hypothetical protein